MTGYLEDHDDTVSETRNDGATAFVCDPREVFPATCISRWQAVFDHVPREYADDVTTVMKLDQWFCAFCTYGVAIKEDGMLTYRPGQPYGVPLDPLDPLYEENLATRRDFARNFLGVLNGGYGPIPRDPARDELLERIMRALRKHGLPLCLPEGLDEARKRALATIKAWQLYRKSQTSRGLS